MEILRAEKRGLDARLHRDCRPFSTTGISSLAGHPNTLQIISQPSECIHGSPVATRHVRRRHCSCGNRTIAVGLLFAFAGLFFTVGYTDAAPPTLTHLFPAGGQRNTNVVVTCTGTFAWPVKVWSPGVEVVPASESGKLEIRIPPDLTADRVWIRLYNDEGASNLLPFLVGSLEDLREVEPNDRPMTAQPIEIPDVTIDGSLKVADVDCFAVRLAVGQTLVAAVDANTRLGSPIDAILQIVSSEGLVLAENHDDLKLDPRLAYTADHEGTYVVRLFAFPSAPDTSIRFSGGADSIYRLSLTTGPFVTHTIPLSTTISKLEAVRVTGWNTPSELTLQVTPHGGQLFGEFRECENQDDLRRSPDARIGFAFTPDFRIATRVRLTPQAALQTLAATDLKTAMTLSVSSSVTGCLKFRRQVDDFRVPLLKGQHVVISAESRSLDLPLDPALKVADPGGSVISDTDDTGASRDAAFAFAASTDGDYQISVSDKIRQGGDRCWYLLTVRPDEPDFELSTTADSFVITHDKPAEVTIKVQRRGSPMDTVGPISIHAIGLPEGITASSAISESTGPGATEVKLSLSSSGASFSGPVRFVGKASQPKAIERFVRTPARLGVAFEMFWLTAVAKP